MTWRLARSLERLRDQINVAYPNRSKKDDGTIASDEHHKQNPKSDHEVNSHGVVCALDITHDPAHGVDTYALAEYMRLHPDKRLRYIISNRKIAGSAAYAKKNNKKVWTWEKYTGSNPHDEHVHFSVEQNPDIYDIADDWDIGASAKPDIPKTESDPSLRLKMAKAIYSFEVRRDKNGHPAIYKLPANDGGGQYEFAGLNDKYNPKELARIRPLISAGKYDEAEAEAIEAIAKDGDASVKAWGPMAPAVESYLRDTIFNRGPHGAARILQLAVVVKDDGVIGPITKAAMAKFPPDGLLVALREARENYERRVVGYRANMWQGLKNRWDGAIRTALTFL